LQARHYARRTVDTYPPEMGSSEVNAFLTHLAVERQVSASTQNQALSALLFLYRKLLERDLDLEGFASWRHCGAEGYKGCVSPTPWGESIPMHRWSGAGKMIYTHVLNRGPLGVCSPADFL
jgi:hypothetical protein